mmetsp:Transcript_108767/g.216005  ORF Transcript_108767/g.216005 Transcript_108767/m.216005 type:complete len:80 (+) Transcript_108767:103-342(+)
MHPAKVGQYDQRAPVRLQTLVDALLRSLSPKKDGTSQGTVFNGDNRKQNTAQRKIVWSRMLDWDDSQAFNLCERPQSPR